MKSVFKKVALAAAIVGAAATASATPIVGIANLSFGLVTVTATDIDWNPPTNPGVDAIPTYGGFFTAGGSNTGSFALGPLVGLTTGLVQDMSQLPFDANHVPIGPGFTPNFLKFAAQPNWIFDAYFLVPGNTGPFTLAQLGNNVSATISLNGLACDGGGNAVCDPGEDITKWTGIFSAQFTNVTIAGLIAQIIAGTADNNTWSGTVEATRLPEPGSMALLGLGLIGLAAVRRRAVK